MPNKDEIAATLAIAHRAVEPTITRIVRLCGPDQAELGAPIKLLEVNTATTASGIWPIAFTPDPPAIPYGSVVIEVTPSEYEDIISKRLALPNGWTLGAHLYTAA